MDKADGMQEPIPVGVVGVGHLGRHHARLYAGMADVKLVGIVDSDENRARSIAAEYDCEVLPDVASLARRVRAASIAVPTQHHCDVATALIRDGVDVLIEKPITRTLAEADEILDAARRAGKLVMVGHTERFNPAVKAFASRVEQPKFFEIHRLAAFSARSTDIDVVLDLMIHDIDLLLAFDGSGVAAVDAVGIAALTGKVDIANARVRFASGCVANLTASRISAETLRRIRLFQPRSYLSCDTGKREVEQYSLTVGSSGSPEIRHEKIEVLDEEPLANELDAFIASVRTREIPSIDGEQARRVLELANRILGAIAEPAGPA